MKPFFVPPHLVPAVWPQALPLVEAALERDGIYSGDDVLGELMLSQAQLWVAGAPKIQAALVTTMERGARGSRLQLWLCGGEGDWAALIETIAEAAGTRLRIDGRHGWARVLPGFRQVGVILEREAAHVVEN